MDWLQTLDVELFRFINLRLINPVLRRGDALRERQCPLPPAAAAGGDSPDLERPGARASLCVLMLALILPLGDGLVCNTIKHAVGRPRPFVVLPEVHRPGRNARLRQHVRPRQCARDGKSRAAVRGQRRLCQHALLARGQLVRGHDDSLHLLSPQRVVHAARGDPGRLLPHLQRRALPERRAGGSDPGRGLRRRVGLVPERALAMGRAKVVSALVAEVPVPARPGPAGANRTKAKNRASCRPALAAFHRGPALAAAGLPLDCGAACWPGWLTSPAAPFN